MSHIEFYDTYVHNVAIIFYIFDFIKVFRQTDVVCNPKRRHDRQKTERKMKRQANASAKSKELQPNAQADTFAAHLLLPNRILTNIDR